MNRTICSVMASRIEQCERAIDELATTAPSPSVITQLRREFGDSSASHLLEVAALQPKARLKFGQGTWWVTGRSLQQATPWQVAARKASWLAGWPVMDLCCGIGGDAMQLAARGRLTAADLDPLLISFAKANVRKVASSESHQFVCQDVTEMSLPPECAIHVDPDRRSDGARTSDPDRYQPDWTQLEKMIEKTKAAVVKLAPAARIRPPRAPSHRCWISLGGRVREQSLICGEAVQRGDFQPGSVSAMKVRADGSFARFAPAVASDVSVRDQAQPVEYLIDPDAAVRAAGLTEAFAAYFGLHTIGGPSGFLTGEVAHREELSDLAIVRRVLWSGSADDRKLRSELRRRNAAATVIKVRGTHHDPAQLARRYRKCGHQRVTLWLGRSRERCYAALTEPTP
jgi:hypothetical protein